MTHSVIRTALGGLVIALVLAACEQGPGSPTPPTQEPAGDGRTEPAAQPLYWSDVLEQWEIPEAIYAVGVILDNGQQTYVLGTAFAAYYTDALWTNAHVLQGLSRSLGGRSFKFFLSQDLACSWV